MEDSILLEVFKSNFSGEELKTIGASLNKIDLMKGDFLLRKGETVSYTYYVHSGCLRSYCVDGSGKEHTLQFAIDDWWISDYTALFSMGKAMLNIECVQDSTVNRLSRKKMERMYIDIPALETFFRKKLERRMEALHKRTHANISLNAKERYLSFIKAYPKISSR